jgi:hypothetical protein
MSTNPQPEPLVTYPAGVLEPDRRTPAAKGRALIDADGRCGYSRRYTDKGKYVSLF